MANILRLLRARNLAVIGGGTWCQSIIKAADLIGFDGDIFPVHRDGKLIAERQSFRELAQVPEPIDAAFVGVNRIATVDVVKELSELQAGGAICFASGFSEAIAEDGSSGDLQRRLVAAAGEMPILGPNCYGFINALDRIAIWPDQHGMVPVESGVAILTQSSNIAINLTMQKRYLPIAYMVTCGNQAQTTLAQIAEALVDDARVTAIGVHVEGFGNIEDWHRLALKAHAKGVPMIAMKVGKSEQAQRATVSHTASIAGDDAGAQALLEHLGIGRVYDVPTFIETLKLLHMEGPLKARGLSAISCSGGEASLAADTALNAGVEMPPLDTPQKEALRAALGPMVSLSNPLDYHTYIWGDAEAMAAAWSAMAHQDVGLILTIVDYPHTDASDWTCTIEAAVSVRAKTGRPIAVVATLPELMPENAARALIEGNVVPMQGLTEAISAFRVVSEGSICAPDLPLPGGAVKADIVLTEAEAKFELSAFDLDLPRRVEGRVEDLATRAAGLMPPLALKGLGIAHKSDVGAVQLGLAVSDLEAASAEMPTDRFLVEEMVTDGVAELLIGITRDPAHGMVLTLGAGGVLTEILQDSVSLLVPASEEAVKQALTRLKCAKLLMGFRGKPAASIPAIVAAVMAVQNYVLKHHARLDEVEINPLICTPTRAVAVDALIRKAK